MISESVEKNINSKTSGILAVHNYGIPGDVDKMKVYPKSIIYLLYMMQHLL